MSRDDAQHDEPSLFDLPLSSPGAPRRRRRPVPPDPARPVQPDAGSSATPGMSARGTPAAPPRPSAQEELADAPTGATTAPPHAPGATPGPSLFQLTAAGAREELDRSDHQRDRRPRLAPLSGRLGAGLVDLAILAAVLAGLLAGLIWMGVPPRRDHALPLLAFAIVFSFLYVSLPLTIWGRTPGMALGGLVARSRDGRPLSARQATLRWLGAVVTLLALGLPALLGLLGLSLVDRISGSSTWQRADFAATPTRPSTGSPGR